MKNDRVPRLYVALLAVCLLSIQGCDPPHSQTSEELATSEAHVTDLVNAPVEYGIACLDSGEIPKGNDINAARIRFLLKAISEKSGDSSQTIADQASRATQVLKKNFGKVVTIRAFLEQVHDYFETGAPKGRVAEITPILIGLMSR